MMSCSVSKPLLNSSAALEVFSAKSLLAALQEVISVETLEIHSLELPDAALTFPLLVPSPDSPSPLVSLLLPAFSNVELLGCVMCSS